MIFFSTSVYVLAAIFVVVIESDPIRFRRQSGSSSTIVIPCPVQCSWTFAQAWTKAISFETPTANMIDDRFIETQNGTFGAMCRLYAGYQQCLRACVASNVEYKNALEVSPTYDQICGQKETDFESYLPCLTNHTKTYQRVCQGTNEHLLAASVRLTQDKFDSVIAKEFCKAANDQSFCILPILRQTCGDGPYDALRTIINATFDTIRVSIGGRKVIETFYPECESFFETIDHGISMTIPKHSQHNQTTSINDTMIISMNDENTTTKIDDTTTKLPLVLRDDVNGSIYVHPTGGRFGPRLRTTTESSGSETMINSYNIMVISMISLLFSIFI